MKASDLPGLNGYFTNSLALNRELARAIGFIQVYRQRSGQEPEATAKFVALMNAAIAAAQAGAIEEEGPGGE